MTIETPTSPIVWIAVGWYACSFLHVTDWWVSRRGGPTPRLLVSVLAFAFCVVLSPVMSPIGVIVAIRHRLERACHRCGALREPDGHCETCLQRLPKTEA